MTETIFEKLAAAVATLKLDFSSEEFALYKAVLLLQVLRIAIRRKCGESIVVLLLLTDAGMYYIGRRSDCQWRGM